MGERMSAAAGRAPRPAARVLPYLNGVLAVLAGAVLLCGAMLLGAAGPARAAGAGAASPGAAAAAGTKASAAATPGAPSGTAPASPRLEGDASQAARLAAALAANPVYISADIPRRVPRSLAPRFAALAKRTGVPTYVMVLPDSSDRDLLGTVHDRLNRNGLYVLVDEYGLIEAQAYGVGAPADDASTVVLYGTPEDAGALEAFRTFADTIASGPAKAAARAAQLRARYGDGGGHVPDEYLDSTARESQNFVLGMALTGLAGLVLAVGRLASSEAGPARAGSPGKAEKPGARTRPVLAPEAAAVRRRGARWSRLAALVVVAGIVVAAPFLFPQTLDGPTLAVSQADLHARTDAIAASLAEDPVYQDPAYPTQLTGADLAAVEQRLSRLRATLQAPVYVVVTPSLSEDETGGEASTLLALLHRRAGGPGVYALVDPSDGGIQLDSYGTRVDDGRLAFELPESVAYPAPDATGDDPRTAPRLEKALDFIAASPRSSSASSGSFDTTLPPVEGNRLPHLFTGDFWPGLLVGALALALLLLLVRALTAIAAAWRRRRAAGRSLAGEPPPHLADLGSRPSLHRLRGSAADDTAALAAALGAADPDAPGRPRAWDCLDAAELLIGGDGRGRRVPDTVSAGDLAAAILLARAGLGALQGRPWNQLCRLDPLHGPAGGDRVRVRLAPAASGAGDAAAGAAAGADGAGGAGKAGRKDAPKSPAAPEPAATLQPVRLCAACRDAVRGAGRGIGRGSAPGASAEAERLLLRLPASSDASHTPWTEAGDVLPAALDGITALIATTRESASVQ